MRKSIIGVILAVLVSGCAGEDTGREPRNSEESSALPAPAEERKWQDAGETKTRGSIDIAELREGQFGFADTTGKRMITLDGEKHSNPSASYDLAIGDSGTVLKVRYQNAQQADSQDNGRATMYNFDHMAGKVYAVTEGTAKPNETYFLISGENGIDDDDDFSVDSSGKGRTADDPLIQRIEAGKRRNIVKAEEVASIGEDGKLFLAEFEKQGNDRLASLIWQVGEELLFYDISAVDDANFSWRVDDQGEIRASDFNVMYGATGQNGRILAVSWLGAEGENSFILAQEGSSLIDTEIRGGRYMAPL